MDPRQPSFDRPNTLGQTWRRMSRSRPRKVDDLPPLPDWPPLPEEGLRAGWPLSTESATPVEPKVAAVEQQTDNTGTAQPQRPLWARQYDSSILGRWRRAPRRMKLGIAGAIITSMLLIAACSNLALHAIGDVGSGASTSLRGASATQQTTGLGGASSGNPTATSSPKASSTNAATSVATSAANLPLTLTFTCASGSVHGTGKVCVHTLPAAALSLSVRYCDGTTAKGLHSAGIADANGDYTWSWSVRMACVGPATATVTARRNGAVVTLTDTFNIIA